MMKRFLPLALTVALSLSALAQLQVPALFSDHMVLQQGASVPVWGWANDGDIVTVEFRGQTVFTTTRNLKWSVKLPALKAGGPDTLTISTKEQTLAFTNVLVGEVWVCSGQSNMEWPMSAAFEP